MRKVTKEEIEKAVAGSTIEVDETIEDVLKEESFSLKVEVPRATDQEIFDVIKPSLRICNECHVRFIKRKEKDTCPMCHSTDIS